jgi:hypothetical protein
MALTAAEQAELDQLEQEQQTNKDQDHGSKVVAQVQAARPVQKESRPFSIYRWGVGSLRDVAQSFLDTADDVVKSVTGGHGDYLRTQAMTNAPIVGPLISLGKRSSTTVWRS